MGVEPNSVLITGGTGALGRALVRKILDGKLSDRVVVLSRGEHAQAKMRRDFGDDPRLRTMIGDVRKSDRLYEAMERCRVVIHAAALKNVAVGQYDTEEMYMTNIWGSRNVIKASRHRPEVRRVVFVSTDKAFKAINAYGKSKAAAEELFLNENTRTGFRDITYSVVRYGNVWNSTNSVVPIWMEAVRANTRAKITDPDCTRFFMHMDDAVNFVLKSAAFGDGQHVAVPKLPAYRLGDLAQAMGITPRHTGLPPYEKLHEEMDEGDTSDVAPRLSIAQIQQELRLIGYQPPSQGFAHGVLAQGLIADEAA